MTPTKPAVEQVALISGGVATARGFARGGHRPASSGRGPIGATPLDLALIVSDTPGTAAAASPSPRPGGAGHRLARALTRSNGLARAVVVNAGCANACTGDEGMSNARDMASETARLVACDTSQVLVASTGVIGVGLPMDKIRSALPRAFAALGNDQGPAAARAIMTTDPFPKEAAARVVIDGREAIIGGMAKGSGMIEPMMATMLGFVTTDASVPAPLLQRALREAVNDTFNAITVDGECSTNDTVTLLANGSSGAIVNEARMTRSCTD